MGGRTPIEWDRSHLEPHYRMRPRPRARLSALRAEGVETPPEELLVGGGRLHRIQLWVNLPTEERMTSPRYQHLEGDQSALLTSSDAVPCAGATDRRRRRRDHRAWHHAHANHDGAHDRVAGRMGVPWRADFNAYVLAGSGRRGHRKATGHARRTRCVRRQRHADRRTEPGGNRLCCSSVDGRSANRKRRTARS